MKRILVALDFSPHAEAVLSVASELARGLSGQLTLVHVAAPDPDFVGWDPGPQSVRDSRAEELKAEHGRLHDWAEDLRAQGIDAQPLLIQGATVEAIVSQADKVSADLIVMGSHAKGPLARVLLGSVSEGVLRATHCPVVVVPDSTG
jgi:nucleotide-binding universal stress UspA family protein